MNVILHVGVTLIYVFTCGLLIGSDLVCVCKIAFAILTSETAVCRVLDTYIVILQVG